MAQRPTLTTSAAAPLGGRTETPIAIGGISVPDSKLAREMAEFVRDTESPLLFHHSSRVYYWGALTGNRGRLRYDPELLYAGAMFHDMGLTPAHASAHASMPAITRGDVELEDTARTPLIACCTYPSPDPQE